jgi:DtxR family Mn-dependent transcriptional regulator
VARVRADDPELLRYLGRMGLYPGAAVVIQRREPFGGPLFLRVAGAEHAVGREVAESVFVQPVSGDGQEEEVI